MCPRIETALYRGAGACVRRSCHRFKAFTLVELLIVISIIALLISIMVPALSTVQELGRMVACSANLRELTLVMQYYAMDNEGRFCDVEKWVGIVKIHPATGEEYVNSGTKHQWFWQIEYARWGGKLTPYIDRDATLVCPTFHRLVRWGRREYRVGHIMALPTDETFNPSGDPTRSYSMNVNIGAYDEDFAEKQDSQAIRLIEKIPTPSRVVLFGEENPWKYPGYCRSGLNDGQMCGDRVNPPAEFPTGDAFGTFHLTPPAGWKYGVSQAGFLDGHVEKVEIKDTRRLLMAY